MNIKTEQKRFYTGNEFREVFSQPFPFLQKLKKRKVTMKTYGEPQILGSNPLLIPLIVNLVNGIQTDILKNKMGTKYETLR